MKSTVKLIIAVFMLVLVSAAAIAVWFIIDLRRQMSPAIHQKWLDTNQQVYEIIDRISESDLDLYAYAFERNVYVDAFPKSNSPPKIANSDGHVPAFMMGSDVFILTEKWVNSSSGLAISESSDFILKIESIDHRFRVRHLSGNVYEWHLNLSK